MGQLCTSYKVQDVKYMFQILQIRYNRNAQKLLQCIAHCDVLRTMEAQDEEAHDDFVENAAAYISNWKHYECYTTLGQQCETLHGTFCRHLLSTPAPAWPDAMKAAAATLIYSFRFLKLEDARPVARFLRCKLGHAAYNMHAHNMSNCVAGTVLGAFEGVSASDVRTFISEDTHHKRVLGIYRETAALELDYKGSVGFVETPANVPVYSSHTIKGWHTQRRKQKRCW